MLSSGQVSSQNPGQFYEVLSSGQVSLRNPVAVLRDTRLGAILQGAKLRRQCSSAGERKSIEVAVNGLEGRGDRGRRRAESKLWLTVWAAAQAERGVHNLLDEHGQPNAAKSGETTVKYMWPNTTLYIRGMDQTANNRRKSQRVMSYTLHQHLSAIGDSVM